MSKQEMFTLESLENRAMLSTVSPWSGATITDPTDFDLYAETRFGDNGSPWGMGEIGAGIPNEEDAADMNTWDSNLSDGLDSGTVNVELVVTTGPSGELDWTVNGTMVSESSGSLGAIRKITIKADATSSNMAFTWGSLSVQFYHNGSVEDSASPGTISASTLSSGNGAEAGATVSTAHTDCDKVVITGTVRLQANQSSPPGETAIFGQILISDQA